MNEPIFLILPQFVIIKGEIGRNMGMEGWVQRIHGRTSFISGDETTSELRRNLLSGDNRLRRIGVF